MGRRVDKCTNRDPGTVNYLNGGQLPNQRGQGDSAVSQRDVDVRRRLSEP